MKIISPRFMPLAAMLCISLFFSCSSPEEPPPSSPKEPNNSTEYVCIYSNAQTCIPVESKDTPCPAGGEIGTFCPPFDNPNPGGSSPSKEPNNPNNYSYYCVYEALQQCFAASSTNCPAGGELSTFCPPFSNTDPTTPSSPSQSVEPNDHYCVFTSTQLCLAVGASTNCSSLGGELSASCPFQQTKPSSTSGNLSSGNQATTKSSSSINNSTLSSAGGVVNPPPVGNGGPVSYYGKLQASGNKLIGSRTGTAVQVRGVSLGWSNTDWGADRFFTAATVNAMVDYWKAEVIRVPIGYSENGGYSTDPSNLTRVKTAINAAIAKDVYVVIDWHSHNAHNETSAATEFFKEMAQTYGSKDNVIFELYNEPLDVSWPTIKTYASSIISTIRQYSDNLILVGTPNWDQNVDVAANSPISDTKKNIAYVFHFYAYSHTKAYYASNIDAVLNAGYPVFVSEYGTTHADGGSSENGNYNTHSAANTDAWHSYMDANKISSCAWNINDKKEASAFFGTGTTFNMSSWTATSSMTPSGQYIYNKLNTYANSAPWRSGVVTQSSSATVAKSSSSAGGGTISTARCKDGSGRDYFCQWGYDDYPSENPGCFAIDPRYAEPAGQTCSQLISDCNLYGSLFISSTEGEGIRCNGTRVSGSTPTPTPSSSSGGTSETGGHCKDGGSYAYCMWGTECSAIDTQYGYMGISEEEQTCGPLAYELCTCADLIQSCIYYSDSKTVYHNAQCN